MRAFGLLALALSPGFFVLHRLSVFHTVPYDDYAPYLLWLAGSPEGAFPGSPYGYRLLSVVAAWPVFQLVPGIGLTNLGSGDSAQWVRATLALNLVSYLALVGEAVVVGWVAMRRWGLLRAEAALAGAGAFALAWFTQVTAIDGLALLMIAGGMALVGRPVAFGLLLAVSVGVNEKVALVLALWLGARVVLVAGDRRRLLGPAASAVAAMVAYFVLLAVVPLPGNEYQTSAGSAMPTVSENLAAMLSARGVMLNLLPLLVLGGAAWAEKERAVAFVVIAGLAVVALRFTHLFQLGRVVMHAAPLFVIPAVVGLRLPRPAGAGTIGAWDEGECRDDHCET